MGTEEHRAGDEINGLINEATGEQIRADRACIGCGFNLFGQPVTREEHYNLAIARCPECGEVAALQSYPTMTHWVNRFRVLIGALWIIILLGAFFGTVMFQVGFMVTSVDLASEEMGRKIGGAYEIYQQELQNENIAANQAGNQATVQVINPTVNQGVQITQQIGLFRGSRWVQPGPKWVEEEFPAVLEQLGGRWENIDTSFTLLLLPAGVVAFAVGGFWSVALLGATRKRAAIVPLSASLIAFALVIGVEGSSRWSVNAADLGRALYRPSVGLFMMFAMLLMLWLGMLLGRKIARFIIRLALPPRARVPFAIFWTRDGLSPPKPV